MAAVPKHRKIVGNSIRELRREAGYSQERLAEKANLHHNYIGEIERGEKNVSIDVLMRIATALRVSIRQFFRGL